MVLMIGILGYEKVVYESSNGHKEDFDVASSLFSTSYCSIFRQTFKLPINRVVKIITSNWIVQSLRRYVYVSFITMWYNYYSGDRSRSSVLVLVGSYNSSFFISRRFFSSVL